MWRRSLTGPVSSNEPAGPVVATEIPGPQSRSMLQELNAIQVRFISHSRSVEVSRHNLTIMRILCIIYPLRLVVREFASPRRRLALFTNFHVDKVQLTLESPLKSVSMHKSR